MRTARAAITASSASPAASSAYAAVSPVDGTAGTIEGNTSALAPSTRIAATAATCAAISGPMWRGRRSPGSALSASTTAPAGSDAAPAKATTPFGPASTPGVAKPCTASSAVIVEKAAPSSTVRPSRRRAPAMVRIADATAAASAPASTSAKCVNEEVTTGSPAAHSITAPGISAIAATAATSGSERSSVPIVTSR